MLFKNVRGKYFHVMGPRTYYDTVRRFNTAPNYPVDRNACRGTKEPLILPEFRAKNTGDASGDRRGRFSAVLIARITGEGVRGGRKCHGCYTP